MGVRNVGNSKIDEFAFDIILPGTNRFVMATPIGDSKLANSVAISCDGLRRDPVFRMKTGYLNPGEEFEVRVYYDGEPRELEIGCRLPDVRVVVVREADLVRRQEKFDRLLLALAQYPIKTAVS